LIALYIGQNNAGSTSGMRARALQKLLNPGAFTLIDTHVPMQETAPLFRSLGFRTNRGPLIAKVNQAIENKLGSWYDLIWVDKANFITPEITRLLRSRTALLVHFTPDCAFYSNQSHLFEKSIPYYDWFISSKSFERQYYPAEKLIEITQGYDPGVHLPVSDVGCKTRDVCFIGLYEKSRGDMVDVLLGANIQVALGGMGWKKCKNLHHPKVEYLGEKVFGSHYAEALGSSRFGLGLLSKHFPELHTTRTFEIPACGTALITERNTDTTRFFTEEEVIFYDSLLEIPDKIIHLTNNLPALERITQNGYRKVTDGMYSYEKILKEVLERIIPVR